MCKGRSKRFRIPRRPYDVAKKKNTIDLDEYNKSRNVSAHKKVSCRVKNKRYRT